MGAEELPEEQPHVEPMLDDKGDDLPFQEYRRSRSVVAVDIALWFPAAFLVWVFARQGLAKFSDTSGWARAFEVWHFPVWFRLLIGTAEVAAALLLLTKRTAALGAGIIAVVMLGGMGTHVYWGRPEQVTSELLPLVFAITVLLGRRHALFGRTGGL